MSKLRPMAVQQSIEYSTSIAAKSRNTMAAALWSSVIGALR